MVAWICGLVVVIGVVAVSVIVASAVVVAVAADALSSYSSLFPFVFSCS